MTALPLSTVLSVLVMAAILMSVQLIILTVEISALRRDLKLLMRTTSSLNHAVNPWAGEEEPTEPNRMMLPPHLPRRRRFGWFPSIPQKLKRRRGP